MNNLWKCFWLRGFSKLEKCEGNNGEDIFLTKPTQEETIQKIEIEKQWTWEDERLMETYACKKNMDVFKRNS